MKKLTIATILFPIAAALCAADTAKPQPAIIYTGHAKVNSNSDGGLRPAVGAQNIEIYRANRTHPQSKDGLPNTYTHQPMLAYWHGKFYLDFLSGPVSENEPPCPTLLTTSVDGVHWTQPYVIFPSYKLPDGNYTITHQRMSFYVAPNGRLLALSFEGKLPEANDGSGVGRVVREIKANGTLGPIYFIRYNRQNGWNETNTPFPFYATSKDAGFVKACKDLLANKLMTAQWWEEDRSTDGFYRIKGKALSFFHRKDGTVVGIWKDAVTSITTDNGQSWTRLGQAMTLPINSSKYWAQRTSDGRYALVLNPTNRLRFPLAVLTSNDGIHFHNMLCIQGELPDQRYPGYYKNMGPQYARGIEEGNGIPPDGDLWVAYSMNKEDIWISRTPVPITGKVTGPVHDNFENTAVGKMPEGWNIYRPLWCPVQVVDAGGKAGHALELQDQDPDDYASVTHVFPATSNARISFKFMARQTDARFEVDVLGAHGERPVQMAFLPNGHIEIKHEGIWKPAGTYQANKWMDVLLQVIAPDRFKLFINGKFALYRTAYDSELVPAVERVTFRTGKYRRRGVGGHEIPGSDVRSPLHSFLIDDVSIVPGK